MTYRTTLLVGAAIFGLLIWTIYSFSKWVFRKIKPDKKKIMKYIPAKTKTVQKQNLHSNKNNK